MVVIRSHQSKMTSIWKPLRSYPRVCYHFTYHIHKLRICGIMLRRICVQCLYDTLYGNLKSLWEVQLFTHSTIEHYRPRRRTVYVMKYTYCKWCWEVTASEGLRNWCGPKELCRKFCPTERDYGDEFVFQTMRNLVGIQIGFRRLNELVGKDVLGIILSYHDQHSSTHIFEVSRFS